MVIVHGVGNTEEKGKVCGMSFDNAELQVPVKHPRGNVPEVIGNINLTSGGRKVGWTDVGVRSIGKAKLESIRDSLIRRFRIRKRPQESTSRR